MAYDPAKAHEYYEKYRKKGLKKGRKRGRKKTASSKTKKQKQIELNNVSKNNELEKTKANAAKYAKALKATKNNSSVSHGSASTAARTVSNEEFAKIKEMAEQIELLKSKISDMSAEDRLTLKTSVQSMISKIKKKVKKNG